MKIKWTPGTPLSLDSANYFLRSMSATDVTNRYIEWAGDAELMENLNTPPRQITREELVRYISKFDNYSRFHLGVFSKDSGLHIGFYTVSIDLRSRVAQINVVIGDRDFWGKKVVIETRSVILDFLFFKLKVERVWGAPFARNFPSIFNYKAQGFTCEGIMRRHGRRVSGERVDQYVFGLLREEWAARRGVRLAPIDRAADVIEDTAPGAAAERDMMGGPL